MERDEHRASTGRQWREMSTGPAQEDSGEMSRGPAQEDCGEMSKGPAQEDTVERDELRASTGRHSGER